MNSGITDRELITRVLKGEQQVYAELVKRYQDFVFTLALRYAPAREDAEEIAQDVFVKAYRALPDFRGDSKFSTWLYAIVNSTSLSFLRKKKLDTRSLDEEKVLLKAEKDHTTSAAAPVEQKSRAAMVNTAIRMLSPSDATLITLFYKMEQSLEEIAAVMGMEPNTAKVKLHRARSRLKEKMQTFFAQEVEDLNY